MKTTSARSLRIAVGTVLLGLGGCTPSTSATTDGGMKQTPPPTKTETKSTHTVNEGPVDPPPKTPEPTPKTPEPTPKTAADDGGCQPPDCHINPGPNDDPKDKPVPPPEELPKVDPPRPEPEPKHVNTGPVKPTREN